jgi:hypothetical protein
MAKKRTESRGGDEPSGMSAGEALVLGQRLLRRYHEGALGLAERRAAVEFVLDAGAGSLVMPMDSGLSRGGVSFGGELVLRVPDETACVLELAIDATRIERPEADEAVDRWAAHHGKSTAGLAFGRCRVEGGKSRGRTPELVWDGSELTMGLVLGRAEYAIVRELNRDPARLARACKVHAGVEAASPTAVGVDGLGINVRARFGVLRLEFPVNEATSDAGRVSEWAQWMLLGDAGAPKPGAKP